MRAKPSNSQLRIVIDQLTQSIDTLEDRIAAVDDAKEELESAKWALKLLNDLTDPAK